LACVHAARRVPFPQWRLPERWAHRLSWCATLVFVFYGWLLFRARSWESIRALTGALFTPGVAPPWIWHYCLATAACVLPLLAVETWIDRSGGGTPRLPALRWRAPWAQGAAGAALFLAILLHWDKAAQPFLYFQF
jgi:hypothetical protein